MSNDTTRFAPRSTSISTSRWPTKPEPPVTTQRAGTAGWRIAAALIWSCVQLGALAAAGIVAQLSERPRTYLRSKGVLAGSSPVTRYASPARVEMDMSMDQSNSINCVKGCDLRLRARARARSATERARIARARRPRPLSLSSEIHNMLTVMRLNARWASGARFRREIPLQAESPLTRGLKALHDHLQGFCDIRDVDTVRYLAPFVAVVRSARASGPLTGAALSSLHKFLLYGFLSRHATRAREAVDLVGAGIAGCVFEETDSESDEVTLMKLLELSALSLRCDAGILLSDLRIWEMFQVGRRARPPPSPPLSPRAQRLRAAGVLSSLVPRARVRAAALDGRQHARAHRAAPLLARARSAAARHAGSAGRAAARAAARRGRGRHGVGRQRRRRGLEPPVGPLERSRRRRAVAAPVRHDAGPDADQGHRRAERGLGPRQRDAFPRAFSAAHPASRAASRRSNVIARCVRRLRCASPTLGSRRSRRRCSRSRSSTLRSRRAARRSARRHRSSTPSRASCASICCTTLRPTNRPSSRSRSASCSTCSPRSRTTSKSSSKSSSRRSTSESSTAARRPRAARPRPRPGARPRAARARASPCSRPRCAFCFLAARLL